MKSDNIVVKKSFCFAVRIVRLYRYLCEVKKEFVLSKQLLRSGTSIGANVKEAVRGQTKADFHAKMNIALKEASESEYWLDLIYKSGIINYREYSSIQIQCVELIKILTSIVKNSE